jgi:hypothetical protein
MLDPAASCFEGRQLSRRLLRGPQTWGATRGCPTQKEAYTCFKDGLVQVGKQGWPPGECPPMKGAAHGAAIIAGPIEFLSCLLVR